MATTVTTQNGTVLRGDAALTHKGELVDPTAGAAATEGGLQTLLRELTRRYDAFLDLRRGRLPLLEYITEHEYTLDEANHLSGFELNAVGRSWFLLKHAGLDQARHDQLLLLIGQDLTRYEVLKQHLERIAKAAQPATLPGPSGYHAREGWDDDYDYDYEDWPYHAHWFWDETSWTWWASDDGTDWYEEDDESSAYWGQDEEYDEYYEPSCAHTHDGGHTADLSVMSAMFEGKCRGKGKGGKGGKSRKGKGNSASQGKDMKGGCHSCGSMNHHIADCPWKGDERKGKGDRRQGGPKGKGKGKHGKDNQSWPPTAWTVSPWRTCKTCGHEAYINKHYWNAQYEISLPDSFSGYCLYCIGYLPDWWYMHA